MKYSLARFSLLLTLTTLLSVDESHSVPISFPAFKPTYVPVNKLLASTVRHRGERTMPQFNFLDEHFWRRTEPIRKQLNIWCGKVEYLRYLLMKVTHESQVILTKIVDPMEIEEMTKKYKKMIKEAKKALVAGKEKCVKYKALYEKEMVVVRKVYSIQKQHTKNMNKIRKDRKALGVVLGALDKHVSKVYKITKHHFTGKNKIVNMQKQIIKDEAFFHRHLSKLSRANIKRRLGRASIDLLKRDLEAAGGKVPVMPWVAAKRRERELNTKIPIPTPHPKDDVEKIKRKLNNGDNRYFKAEAKRLGVAPSPSPEPAEVVSRKRGKNLARKDKTKEMPIDEEPQYTPPPILEPAFSTPTPSPSPIFEIPKMPAEEKKKDNDNKKNANANNGNAVGAGAMPIPGAPIPGAPGTVVPPVVPPGGWPVPKGNGAAAPPAHLPSGTTVYGVWVPHPELANANANTGVNVVNSYLNTNNNNNIINSNLNNAVVANPAVYGNINANPTVQYLNGAAGSAYSPVSSAVLLDQLKSIINAGRMSNGGVLGTYVMDDRED